MIALDVEPLVVEANRLLQGLAILSRVAREEQDETEGLLPAGSRQAFLPPQAGEDHTMTTPNTEIGAITLRTMRAKLDEAAEGCAVDGHPARAFVIALDIEPLAVEANRLLQGLAILSRVAREEQDEVPGGTGTDRAL